MANITVSCKLNRPQVDRLTAAAEAQGGTKASLLKRLALDYLQNGGKVDTLVQSGEPRLPSGRDEGLPSGKTRSADRLHQRKSPSSDTSLGRPGPDEGLPTEYLLPFHRLVPPTNPISTPVVDSGLPSNVGVDARSSVPLPTSRQPVYHNAGQGRPATSPRPSAGILLLGGLFLFLLARSRSVDAVDHVDGPVRQVSLVGGIGLHDRI